MKNREIKFRAWSGEDMIYQGLSNGQMTIGDLFNNYPSTLMQFTGLTDKNGVEIYEGDYLVDRYKESGQWKESLLKVRWCSESLQWAIDGSFTQDGSFLIGLVDYLIFDALEVRGNVFENPKNEEK